MIYEEAYIMKKKWYINEILIIIILWYDMKYSINEEEKRSQYYSVIYMSVFYDDVLLMTI